MIFNDGKVTAFLKKSIFLFCQISAKMPKGKKKVLVAKYSTLPRILIKYCAKRCYTFFFLYSIGVQPYRCANSL